MSSKQVVSNSFRGGPIGWTKTPHEIVEDVVTTYKVEYTFMYSYKSSKGKYYVNAWINVEGNGGSQEVYNRLIGDKWITIVSYMHFSIQAMVHGGVVSFRGLCDNEYTGDTVPTEWSTSKQQASVARNETLKVKTGTTTKIELRDDPIKYEIK